MHAPAAPAPAAPQPTSTGPAQRRSVSLTAAETTGPAEDDLCPAQLGYTPLRPLYPQRQTTQRGPAQQHLLQWRQPAQQTIDTANHRPAQQRPCGRDNRPGELHLSKSTPPLCSPLCRYGPNNSAVDNIQTSRSSNGVHELFTIFGSHPPSSQKWGHWSQNGMDESHRIVEPHQQSKTTSKSAINGWRPRNHNPVRPAQSAQQTTFWLTRALVGYISHYNSGCSLTGNPLSPQLAGRPPGGPVPGREPWLCLY